MKTPIFFLFFTVVTAELYSAIDELANLSKNNILLKREYENLIDGLKNVISKIERRVEIIDEEQNIMNQDSVKYVSNPLNAFLMIKRLSVDVSEAIVDLNEIVENFGFNCEAFRLAKDDYDGAGNGLARVQIFYGLETKELAKGVIQGQPVRKELTVDDLFSIGRFYLDQERHELSLSYFELAFDKNNETHEMTEMEILEAIHDVHSKTGNTEELIKTIEKMIEILPDTEDRKAERQYELDEVSGKLASIFMDHFQKQVDTCTGKSQKTPRQLARLRCRFVSKSAFSKLTPFKLEEISIEPMPYVVIYHDVISDAEIKVFKDLCKSTMTRASVQGFNQTREVTEARTSKHCIQLDSDHEVFARMSQRVEDMTGLHKNFAEPFQTQNYGIGGHYNQHYDFDLNDKMAFGDNRGNRIASMLFYFSDVQLGGATSFPLLQTRILPEKGAAVFWYNMDATAQLDFKTLHSGCPVLVGSKWVANKWIRAFGQEWNRPCPLKPFKP